jgi:hypothetical protein
VFAVFKVVATFMIACASVLTAIVESGHPALLTCLFAAFIVGVLGAEAFRAYRRQTVRSLVD